MKLFKKIRKGFTLIELVVVIAVIAILSAVSIVSYVSITNKAKQSNDQQKIDQVNLSLAALEVDGKPKTMYEAVKAVEDDGFKPENFKEEAKNYRFAYAMEENKFVIVEKQSKVVYPKDLAGLACPSANLWLFEDAASAFEGGFSRYLRGEGLSGEVSADAGIDVGDNSGISKVTYVSSASQDVVIRTIGGALEVGSSSKIAKGTVKHYNYVDSALVYTEKNSFHAYGAVGQMKLKEGRAVAEKGGIIYLTEAPAEAEVKQSGGIVVIPAGVSTESVDRDVAASIGYNAPAAAETYDAVVPSTDKSYNIGSLSELENFRDIVNGGFNFKGLTVKLTKDITLEKGWTPIGEGSRKVKLTNYDGSYLPEQDGSGASFSGIFDGGNHTIANLNFEGYQPSLFSEDAEDSNNKANTSYEVFVYGFFGVAYNATFRNVKFSNVNIDFSANISRPQSMTALKYAQADSVGTLVGWSTGTLMVENVSVLSGSVKGGDAISGVVGRVTVGGNAVTIQDCLNKADITSARVASGIARIYSPSAGNVVTVKNNTNAGSVVTTGTYPYVGGITVYTHTNMNLVHSGNISNNVAADTPTVINASSTDNSRLG